MIGLLIATMRLLIHIQITTIQHMVYLHKMLQSRKSDYMVLETNIKLLNDASEVLKGYEDVSDI